MPFFTLVGVQLNLPILAQSVGFGVLVFFARALCIMLGSYVGGSLAGLDRMKRTRLWMTMLAQAGVSLGLAAEVAVKFPEWGSKFQSTIFSVVLINQFVGPVLCKVALRNFGEAGKMLEGEEDEHGGEHGGGGGGGHPKAPTKLKRALIFGVDATALSTAAKLLKAGWRVSLVDASRQMLVAAGGLGVPKEHTNSSLEAGEPTLTPSPFETIPPPQDNASAGILPSVFALAKGQGQGRATSSSAAADKYTEHRGPVVFHDGAGSFGSSSYKPASAEQAHLNPGSSSSSSGSGGEGSGHSIAMNGPFEPLLDLVLVASGAAAATVASSSSASAAGADSPSVIATWGAAVGSMDCAGVDAVILGLGSDQANYELGVWLVRARRAPRVIVRSINAAWSHNFQQQGLLPVSELAATSAVLNASAQSRGNLTVVSATLSLHDALHSLISPVEDVSHTLLALGGDKQASWESSYPGPSAAGFAAVSAHLSAAGLGPEVLEGVHALSAADLRTGRIDFLERMHSIQSGAHMSQEDHDTNQQMNASISSHGLADERRRAAAKAELAELQEAEDRQLKIALSPRKN